MDALDFSDPGVAVARAELSGLPLSTVHGVMTDLLRLCEAKWCEAVAREHARSRRLRSLDYRPDYSAEELLAEHLLETLGAPCDPVAEAIRKIGEAIAERERRAAARTPTPKETP